MKNFYESLLLISLCLVLVEIQAQQVPKKIIVEHFTNTRCGICAVNNPGFYNILHQKSNILHITFHPSSPYSSCLFSTQNKSENDARTNYYGIYGGTPVYVINGNIKSASQVQTMAAYSSFENQMTPISVTTNVVGSGENIAVNVEIKAEENNNLGSAQLYVALVEDTIWYNAPNGENIHHDVFRKSFSGNNPITFNVPNAKGNTYIYQASIPKNSIWKSDRLSAIAIVSSADKVVIQSDQSLPLNATLSSTDFNNTIQTNDINISPNPANYNVRFTSTASIESFQYRVLDSNGKLVLAGNFSGSESVINIENIPNGTYHVLFIGKNSKNQISKSFVKY